jgi:hypothetical protein
VKRDVVCVESVKTGDVQTFASQNIPDRSEAVLRRGLFLRHKTAITPNIFMHH